MIQKRGVVDVPMNVSVAIAKGKHPVPSRTRKLSPSAPMVLHGRPCGRVGRRRTQRETRKGAAPKGRPLFLLLSRVTRTRADAVYALRRPYGDHADSASPGKPRHGCTS